MNFTIVGTGAEKRSECVDTYRALSLALLPNQAADFVFTTYSVDLPQEDVPQNLLRHMQESLSGNCALLSACAKGRMIMPPRELAASVAFDTLDTMIHAFISHVLGRPGKTMLGE